ncbi:MAG: stimulus-sensing domain-containing protein [Hyphomicrobiaceae bacterium]
MALDTNRAAERVASARRMAAAAVSMVASLYGRLSGLLTPVAGWLGQTRVAHIISQSLLRRILVSNLLGLFFLLGGVFYLSATHSWLLEAKRQSLQKQGQIIAGAIGENTRVESGFSNSDLMDPKVPFRDDAFSALEFSLSPERLTPILNRIIKPTDARARIYDRKLNLVVDTSTLLQKGKGHVARPDPEAADATRPRTRNFWTKITQWMIDGELPVYREIGNANGAAYLEVQMALQGHSTAVLLLDSRGEQIVAIAEPIRRAKNKTVQGVLFLSTRPGEISAILSEERSVIWTLAAFAFLATLTSSWLLARTVADPMRQLSEAADHVSRNLSARKELPEYSDRKDEVGQMASAFGSMTAALFRRIEASEKFAADVAHELKNPLAAARSCAESISYARTDEQRNELVEQIQGELKRLNRLITDVASASRLDAELARQKMQPLDVRHVLDNVSRTFGDILASDTRSVVLNIEPTFVDTDYLVVGHDGRLGQVLTNLVDNAISFSPEKGIVTVDARRVGQVVEISITDQGPGIPEDRLEEIFARFYSDRPETDQKRGKNSGLGLSISREIVMAHNGRIFAENVYPVTEAATGDKAAAARRVAKGARFTVQLPLANTLQRGGVSGVRRA